MIAYLHRYTYADGTTRLVYSSDAHPTIDWIAVVEVQTIDTAEAATYADAVAILRARHEYGTD